MSENKIIAKFNQIVSSENFLLISCALVFCLSIFLRSIIDIGPDTGVYLDLGREIARGGKYYYDFFESNFPASFYVYALQYNLSVLSGINQIIMSEIFVNILGLLSIYYSSRILHKTTIYENRAHYNLIILSYFIGFFIRANAIQLGEFGTKTSFLLICFYPYLSYSFAAKNILSRSDLVQRGVMMGLIPCFKPHYLLLVILIEMYRFWQRKSERNLFRFILEIDKLVMILIGVIYLLLMLKLTPEFFEFVVPMWPKVYHAYDDPEIFFNNVLHRLGAGTAIYCFIFLPFTRLKFSENDRILFLVFCSVSLLTVFENIGTIDQLAVLYALYTTCFMKITYDLILSSKYSFRDNKFIMIVLLVWPIFDMEILPGAIFSLSGFINVWWFIALVYPFIFCYQLRKKDYQEFTKFRQKYLTKLHIFSALIIYFTLLILVVLSLKYLGAWGFMVTNLFALFFVQFCFEKFYAKFSEKFSSFAVFTITTSISCLLYMYIFPVSNLIPTKHYDTYPNKLSDAIMHYVKKYAPQKQESFLVFSDLIVHQFAVMNYLDKENYHITHVVNTMAQRGFLNSSSNFSLSKDQDKILTLSYLFEDLKKQITNQNLKVIFVNNRDKTFWLRDRCLIGFLEYYLLDPEFRKLFFSNFRFESRVLSSVEVKNPIKKIVTIQDQKKDIFDDVELSKEMIRYDFEVYVRK